MVRERLAVDVLEDDVVIPIGDAAIEDPDNPGRLEPGGESGLAEKPRGGIGPLRQVRVQELDCHVEIEVAVPSPVDDTQPALADPGPIHPYFRGTWGPRAADRVLDPGAPWYTPSV
jgi:hypothetical protein